ncbi:MAG TPA: hypothetical protein V6C58_17375 [Allocoleopsis sp.]
MTELQKLVLDISKSSGDLFDILSKDPYCFDIKHSEDCYMLSFTKDSDISKTPIRQANGTIFEKETNKILHFSFSKCYEGIENFTDETNVSYIRDVFSLETLKNMNKIKIDIEEYVEGSIIKLYYHRDKWNIATSRSIEADKNYWGSESSFRDIFFDIVGYDFLESLDSRFFYTYILQHPKLHSLLGVTEPRVKILCKVNRENLTEQRFVNLLKKTLEEAMFDVKNFEVNYMVYINTDSECIRIKLLNDTYLRGRNLLGNTPNIFLRYIELMSLGDINSLSLIKQKFPHFTKKFHVIQILFHKTCIDILNSYHIRYTNGDFSTQVNKNHWITVNQLYSDFLNDNKKVSYGTVKKKLLSLYPKTLAKVIGFRV